MLIVPGIGGGATAKSGFGPREERLPYCWRSDPLERLCALAGGRPDVEVVAEVIAHVPTSIAHVCCTSANGKNLMALTVGHDVLAGPVPARKAEQPGARYQGISWLRGARADFA